MKTQESKSRFLLVYGSATGQAQAIAEEIASKVSNFGLTADLHCLEETGKKFNVENETCIVMIISTSGDGDPPSNAEKFVRRIKKRTLTSDYLQHMHYALLGLGDSNYSNFCRCGRDMDKRLEELGAKRFYATGLADDAVGLEVVADPWLDGLYPALQKFLGVTSSSDGALTERVEALSLSENSHSLQNSIDTDENTQTHSEAHHVLMNSVTADAAEKNHLTTETDVIATATDNSRSENKEDTGIYANSNILAEESLQNLSKSKTIIGSNQDDSAYNSEGSVHAETNIQKSVSNHDKFSHSQLLPNDIDQVDTSNIVEDTSQKSQDYIETTCLPIAYSDSPLNQLLSLLSEQTLTIPVLPPPFLKASFSNSCSKIATLAYQNGYKLPCAASGVFYVTVISAQVLTAAGGIKKTLLLRLNLEGTNIKYSPGDSISIVCHNNSSEVDLLLKRLDVMEKADLAVTLSVIPETTKRRAAVPPHINPTSTLRHIFKTCLNIRESPGKAFIRALAEHTSDPQELRRMQEFCSKEGAQEYTRVLHEHRVTLLDFLYAFPSCKPPVERILEHLPRLQPRPYSVCSCQEENPNSLDVVFNVVEIPANVSEGHYYSRRGVCTGWLDDISSSLQAGITGAAKIEIPIFLRNNQHFHPPEDLTKPLIMIGPGTGVAPFIGFLQQRALKKHQLKEDQPYGETWLFYGCRSKDQDYLFRNEQKQLESDGVLSKLCVAFSRDQSQGVSDPNQNFKSPKYVQDLMCSLASELCYLLTELETFIYVCGDAKNMAKDVSTAFESLLQKEKGMSQDDAHMFMMKKRIHKTYFEDVWV